MERSQTPTTRARAQIRIEAPLQTVRAHLSDPTSIAAFHPLVRSARPSGAPNATRECAFIPMGVATERLAWHDNELVAELVAGRNMPPIAAMTGRLILEADGSATVVTFVLEYRMKPGVLPAIVNAAMVRPQFTRAPAFYVAGLKHLVERGSKAGARELTRLGWTPA